MTALLIALNVVAGLFLVCVVLLQAGKGADMGAAFGGANPAAFGPAAQGNVLQKITALTAAVFMGSSLALAVVSSREKSVFDDMAEPAPVAAPVAPVAIPGEGGVAEQAPAPAAEAAPAAPEAVAEGGNEAASAVGEAASATEPEAPAAAETPPSSDTAAPAAEPAPGEAGDAAPAE